MNRLVLLLMGRVILMCSGLQLIPFCYSLYHGYEQSAGAFAASVMIALLSGVWLIGLAERGYRESLSVLDGAAFLAVCWWVMSIFGGLPYYIDGDLGIANAFFDSISCFTTTGVMDLPYEADNAIILWRSLSQWLGGYMVLLLLSTVLPGTSGCFGTAFILSGNMRTGAITLKRINRTSVKLLKIYSAITLGGILLYWLCGLSVYDAVNMSLVTISTGGCYTPDARITVSGWVAVTAILGIVAAGCNILLYWQAVDHKEIRALHQTWKNSETRIFVGLVLCFTGIIAVHLYLKGYYDAGDAISNALFHVVSFGCTNGIMAEGMYHWDDVDKFFLMCMALIGGCIGSISGGFKIFRLQVLLKSSLAELKRTLHPHMVVHIEVDGKAVPQKIIERILGYFFMFFVTILVSLLVISLSGLNMQQTMDVAIACITSSGPMMMFHLDAGEVRKLPDWVKLYCSLLMVIGKVNVFTFLLIVHGVWNGLQERQW